MPKKKKVEKIKEALLAKEKTRIIEETDWLSSGATMLNLASTGRHDASFAKGFYYFMVGDSSSGKTFLSLTCLAEAGRNPNFDDYRFIYDAPEEGALMDFNKFFGKAVADRIEFPAEDDQGNPCCSDTVEEFYVNANAAFENGPCIYILDSQDALSSGSEIKKFQEEQGGSGKGSYGDGKARYHSSHIRQILKPLRKSKSILLILAQTRDSFDPFSPKAYSGGRALLFYSTLQWWTGHKGKLYKTVQGKKRQIGILSKIQVKKNRITGQDRTIEVPIYRSYGIDDLSSCVDYLLEEKTWSMRKNTIVAIGLGPDLEMTKDKLVEHIEEKQLEDEVSLLCQQTWDEVEESCKLKRKSRYDSNSST